ncbi:MAG: methyltransferase [Prolixibacteraceae bacterium]|nr:methyltransferase [Prolixibacteraceae bacterium]
MPHNNYFQFKQFKVVQNHAAMRVGTDGVMLGAWADVARASRILDIGTGTGVIALMLAQRNRTAQIDAIEIEEGAVNDASANFINSPWKERLQLHHISAQDFAVATPGKFDLIVCNPPFFNQCLQSPKKSKNIARHTSQLTFKDLIGAASKLLTTEGRFIVVLPSESEEKFRAEAASAKLFPAKITRVKPNPVKPVKRVLIAFALEATLKTENELTIETETRHVYTEAFQKMVETFYL